MCSGITMRSKYSKSFLVKVTVILFWTTLLLVQAADIIKEEKGASRQDQEDTITFLMNHLAGYKTVDEFRKFLDTAPPLLHPSLAEMWLTQQKARRTRNQFTPTDRKMTEKENMGRRRNESVTDTNNGKLKLEKKTTIERSARTLEPDEPHYRTMTTSFPSVKTILDHLIEKGSGRGVPPL